MQSPAPPNAIFAVDLQKLSQLAKCTQKELLHGMQTTEIELTEPERESGIQQMLISAAVGRPAGVLEKNELPKCLIQLGGKSIISHILSHVFAAGLKRLVISVAHGAADIMAEIKRHPVYGRLDIEFLNLGPTYRGGHARSILAAKKLFHGRPFLIHTSDHIFEYSILHEFANLAFNIGFASVLVETDMASIEQSSLPATAVKVCANKGEISEIGRTLSRYNGIEAGLFVCGQKLFTVLENLASMKAYFSLADALNVFAQQNKLTCVQTDGRLWASIETEEQLQHARGEPLLSPWSVVVSDPGAIQQRKGFCVQVQRDQRRRRLRELEEGSPLLYKPPPGTAPSHFRTQSSYTSLITRADTEPEIAQHHSRKKTNGRQAYLLELPPASGSLEPQQQLFIPLEKSTRTRRRTFLDRTLTLPTDVSDVTLEAVGPQKTVQMVVRRKVPVIGLLILLAALLAASTVGAALNLQVGVSPIMKFFWRLSLAVVCYTPLAALSLYRQPLSGSTSALGTKIVLCGLCYAVFSSSFLVAIDLTSVGEAYLFNNAHSIIIVLGRMAMGLYVSTLEGIGAFLGILGGILCSMDTTAGTTAADSAWLGNLIAFIGAVGGVLYLTYAKQLRTQLDLFVFMWSQMCVACCATLCYILLFEDYQANSNANNGLLGWTTSSRLAIDLYLVLVGNMLAGMGFISVLKYFDPIVISVVMLMEPVVASVFGVFFIGNPFPGQLTCAGGSIVLLGTLMVIQQSAKKKTQRYDIRND